MFAAVQTMLYYIFESRSPPELRFDTATQRNRQSASVSYA